MYWRPNHFISSPIYPFSLSPLKLVEVFGQTLPHRKRVGSGWWWKAAVGTRPLGSRTLSHSVHTDDVDNGAGPSLFPLHRCKTVHLVRHAQGIHNVEGDKDFKAYMSPDYFDAHLTPLGWQQVDNLRKHVYTCGLAKRIELVITSPLMRTLQTAAGVFGGEGYTDVMDVVPLMVANTGNSDRAAISSLDCPPIIALELCRERERGHPCDNRRNISDYRVLFPAVDFSLIESDEDTFWRPEGGETKEEVAVRGLKLINWLWTRKEKEIAIVSHRGFLFNTLSAFGNDCHPLVKEEICKSFANCELRSMVIIDGSMMGSDSSTTNYLGGIPVGLDLPSDAVADKKTEKGPDNNSALWKPAMFAHALASSQTQHKVPGI